MNVSTADESKGSGSFGELLDWETVPLMFTFCDPDGNRLYVTEAS
jgi:hypothetical protein